MWWYYWNRAWICGMSVHVFRGVAVMITVMDIQVLYNAGKGFAVWTNFMFTRRTSLQGVINLQTQQLWDRLRLLDSTCIQEGLGDCSRYSDSLRAGRSGDRIPVGGEIFHTRPDRLYGPPSLLYTGYRVSFPGVKRPGRGVDHLPHLNLSN